MSGEERTEMFSKPLEQHEYDRQTAIDDAEMDHIYSDSVLHWRTRALDLEARLADATRLAESRAVEVAELRSAIVVTPIANGTVSVRIASEYADRVATILNRPADARGTEILAAARDSVDALGSLLRHFRRHTDHRCEIDRDAEDAEARLRALVGGQEAGEAG